MGAKNGCIRILLRSSHEQRVRQRIRWHPEFSLVRIKYRPKHGVTAKR